MAAISTATYKIRFATVSDVPVILQLINELASYENALSSVLATEASLKSSLSFIDENGDFSQGYAKTLLISPADEPQNTAGMALHFHNYSTWHAAPGIFLEDLFVRETFRKRGYGKALLQALARECMRLNCKRLEWNVLKWNTPSILFYESEVIGAKMLTEWSGMRVDGDRLEKLANLK